MISNCGHDERYWKEFTKEITEKIVNKEISAEEALASAPG